MTHCHELLRKSESLPKRDFTPDEYAALNRPGSVKFGHELLHNQGQEHGKITNIN